MPDRWDFAPARARVVALVVAAALVVVVGGVLGCDKGEGSDAKGSGKPGGGWGGAASATPVIGARIVRGRIGALLTTNGRLEPVDSAPIAAPIAGTIATLLVDVGDRVTAGQVVATFDTRALKHRAAQAALDRQNADAQARRAALSEATALSDSLRAKRLYAQYPEDAEGVFSKEEVANLENAWKLAALDAEIARLTLARATDAATDLAEQVTLARVRAPFSGVITARPIHPNESATVGQTLFELVDVTRLELPVRLTEAETEGVFVGQHALILGRGRTPFVYPASVTRLAPVVDTESGLVGVTLEVAAWPAVQGLALALNTERLLRLISPLGGPMPAFPFPAALSTPALRPGMFVAAQITIAEHARAILVPKTAVQYDQDRPYVFVVERGRAWKRPLTLDTDFATENAIEAIDGIEPGAIVVVRQADLKEDTPVTLSNATALGLPAREPARRGRRGPGATRRERSAGAAHRIGH